MDHLFVEHGVEELAICFDFSVIRFKHLATFRPFPDIVSVEVEVVRLCEWI